MNHTEITPMRRALLDLWEQLYLVQVLIVAMDPDLLDQIGVQAGLLQYRIRLAKQAALSKGNRGRVPAHA